MNISIVILIVQFLLLGLQLYLGVKSNSVEGQKGMNMLKVSFACSAVIIILMFVNLIIIYV